MKQEIRKQKKNPREYNGLYKKGMRTGKKSEILCIYMRKNNATLKLTFKRHSTLA